VQLFRVFGEVALRGGEAVINGLKKVERTAQGVSERLDNMGQRMADVGDAVSTLTLPFGLAGAAGIKMAADVESGTARIQAALGTTRGEAERLGQIAQQVWKAGWGESLADVDQAIVQVTQNMGRMSPASLETITKSALMLRDVFDADVNESVRAAGVMMKNFGITGEQAMDLITYGFQKGGDFAGDLLDTLTEYSPQFKAMGFSADQMLSILIAGAQAGAFNLDKVGDAIKEMNIRMKDGSDTTREAFEALGLNAKEMEAAFAAGGDSAQKAFAATMAALAGVNDEAKRNQIGVALMGTMYEDLEKEIVASMSEGAKAHIDFAGAADKAKQAIETSPYQRFQALMRELATSLQPVGKVLMDLAERYLPPMANFIANIAQQFAALPPGVQTAIISFAGLVAAIGPVLSIGGRVVQAVGTVITTFGKLGTAIKAVGTAFNALRLVFMTNPFMLIVTAIVVVAALIITHWDQIKSFLASTWEGIKNTASRVWDAITAFFKKWGPTILSVLTGPIGALVIYLVRNWDQVKAKTQAIWNAIKSALSSAWSAIKSTVSSAINGVRNTITNIWNSIKSVTSGAWSSIKSIISKGISSAWSTVKGYAGRFLSAGKALLDSLAKGIKQGISKAISAVKNGMARIRSFLPFSPAKEGPLSDLDKSGESFFPTWAEGVEKGTAGAVRAVSAGMSRVQNALGRPAAGLNVAGAAGLAGMAAPIIITGNNFYIREESDIEKVSRALYLKTRERQRGPGVIRV